MDILRSHVMKDVVYFEGGLAARPPVTRAAACVIIHNPLVGRASEDLSELVSLGEPLGELLVREAALLLPNPVISYGKAAIVGSNGEIEHAAAILHPGMGKPIRSFIGGGKAVIPSTQKIGAAGTSIDVPLGHKDDPWSFDHIDTLTLTLTGAPRSDEIVVIVALADGGRPRPRVGK
ncbi:MAG: peptide synthetase [Rhizobiales bacterium 65-79]|nr:amino acid synthesis family protein [Hyphomicrobiales bacterium]OJU01374.1 MAG: peptide synthetase [Rhizobiales bacterium 65-79]